MDLGNIMAHLNSSTSTSWANDVDFNKWGICNEGKLTNVAAMLVCYLVLSYM